MKNKPESMDKTTFTPTGIEALIVEAGPEVQQEMQQLREQYSLSRKLRHMRLDAGLTQAQMAERMGRSQSYISKIESAENSRIGIEDFSRYVICTQQKTALGKPVLANYVVDGLASFFVNALCHTAENENRPTNPAVLA